MANQSKIEWDTKAAVKFLRSWKPSGPWVLTSIVPDGMIETVTFHNNDVGIQSMLNWIEKYQNNRNMYFHVNTVRADLRNKASKEDVASVDWLHVDIDPRPGEDPEDERDRAIKLLKNYKQHPTCIIDSGGGYQGFWKLRQPDPRLEINGSVAAAVSMEAYNIQIERDFQGDHCHNVDRIMRLPGTVNLPTEKKRKKGRKPSLAKLVYFKADQDYPLDVFKPAVVVQCSDGGLSGGQPKIKITGNVADVGVEELQAWAVDHGKNIGEHTLALIATGQDPIDPTKYPSRSEALFKVCCDLIRADVPEEMIFAVITGSNEIATSVRDKPNWESYALRQIERAREDSISPVLRQLNEKHAVISDIGGRCRIISEVFDAALGRTKISKQSFDDFRNRYRNLKVQVGVNVQGVLVEKPAGTFWIDHPARRQYDTLIFSPGREVDNAYNLWRGFACDSVMGNKHESFLLHIRDNICAGNPEYYSYLLGWLARMVQHPDGPGEVAVVMRGARGTGKSFFAKVVGSLFGRHFLQVSDSKHLVGSFNAHLRDTVVLFGDEAFFAGDKKHESVLKTLVTEEHLVIEGKGVDAEAAPNFVHLILASNEDWVVPAGLDERRFFVLEVGGANKQNHAYFKRIHDDLNAGGRENLLHFLMNLDLSEFEVRRVPQTEALREQKLLSMTPETHWFYDKLMEGRLMSNTMEWQTKVAKDLLYEDYVRDMNIQGRRSYLLSKVTFGKFLSRVLPKGYPLSRQDNMLFPAANDHGMELVVTKRCYIYVLPPLADCRDYWDKHMGGPYDWPQVEAFLPNNDEDNTEPF